MEAAAAAEAAEPAEAQLRMHKRKFPFLCAQFSLRASLHTRFFFRDYYGAIFGHVSNGRRSDQEGEIIMEKPSKIHNRALS